MELNGHQRLNATPQKFPCPRGGNSAHGAGTLTGHRSCLLQHVGPSASILSISDSVSPEPGPVPESRQTQRSLRQAPACRNVPFNGERQKSAARISGD